MMRWTTDLWFRFRALIARDGMERDLDEEFAFHMEMEARKLEATGMTPDEARRTARLNFGGEERFKEKARESWGVGLLTDLVQDTRFAARSLRRSLGFASVAVLTLGLGVGVTTAMFTVVNGALARPLPFFEPDRLVALSVLPPELITLGSGVQGQHFVEIRRESSSFARMATYSSSSATLTGAGQAVRLRAASATTEFIDVLGVRPALGRGFSPEDAQPGANPVVVLGDALWRSRFGTDPNIVGTTVVLDGVPRTIVGVMPPNFDFPARAELWLPMAVLVVPGQIMTLPVVARLLSNVNVDQASAELSALAVASSWRFGRSEAPPSAQVFPLKDLVVGNSGAPILIFTGAVALIFLISCTNVANLLLMRAGTREREIGVRRALGAGRERVVRQLLTESMMVAFLGGALGIVVAAVGVRALLALAPPGTIPRGQEIRIDLAVLAFTLTISALAGIGFGLAPAFKATRRELRDTIAEGARTLSPRGGLIRGMLVVAEVALAVVLLTGAGLLLRSFQQIRAIDLGFQPENTVTFSVALPGAFYTGGEAMAALHRRVLEGLEQIPGVAVAGAGGGIGSLVGLAPSGASTRFNIQDAAGERSYARASGLVVSPDYFRAMGVTLRSGRGFTPLDDVSAPPVIVINESMAEQFWPNRDPLGERFTIRNIEVTIVGVAADVVTDDIIATPGPTFYLPMEQEVDRTYQLDFASYVVRSAASPGALAPAIRAVLRDADPNLPPGTISSMDDILLASAGIGERLFQTRILSVFAVLALLLAAVGVYGVTAYSVSERTREIGIRMALGARAEQVAGMTLLSVLTLVVPGLVLGSAGGLAASRLIAASLYEIEPTDPATFVAVALLLGGVAIAAALVPARRATQVSPVEVLNS